MPRKRNGRKRRLECAALRGECKVGSAATAPSERERAGRLQVGGAGGRARLPALWWPGCLAYGGYGPDYLGARRSRTRQQLSSQQYFTEPTAGASDERNHAWPLAARSERLSSHSPRIGHEDVIVLASGIWLRALSLGMMIRRMFIRHFRSMGRVTTPSHGLGLGLGLRSGGGGRNLVNWRPPAARALRAALRLVPGRLSCSPVVKKL